MGNHQVRFLGEGAAEMPLPYPTPLKKTPIAYRACGLHNGPKTWFTSGWRIYFPSLCCGGRYHVCCLEWLKDRICANWLNGPRGDKVKGGVLGQT